MKKNLFFHTLFMCILISSNMVAQTLNPPLYTSDGEILDLDQKGDTLIVAGSFGHTGIYTGGIAKVSSASDYPSPLFPRVSESMASVTKDGNGGYYALQTNGYIIHILPNNSIDPAFSIQVGSAFWMNKMIYYNGTIYIGLVFPNASNSYFEAYNVATQQSIANIPYVNHGISNFRINNGILYLMGDFDTVGTSQRIHIAAFDLSSNTLTSWYPQFPQLYNGTFTISDLAFYGNNIILSGGFWLLTGSNSATIYKCAVFNTATGAFDHFIFPEYGGNTGLGYIYWGANGNRVAVSGDKLFLFTSGTFDTRLTAYDMTNNTVLWARFFEMTGDMGEMLVLGNTIYAGGDFNQVFLTNQDNSNNSNIELDNVKNAVAFNINTGAIQNWHPNTAEFIGGGGITSMLLYGNDIVMGGSFTHVNALDRPCVYLYKTDTQQVLPFSIQASAPFGSVYDVKLIGTTLYVAGDYDSAWGANNNATVRAYNINTGAELAWYPAYFGTANAVEANGQFVFISGNVQDTTNGIVKSKLLAIDRNTGQVANWDPNPDGTVRALRIADGKLYVGGSFTSIAGQSINHLASFDLGSLTLSSTQPPAVGDVYCIKADDSLLYVGGVIDQFDTLNFLDRFVVIRLSDGSLKKYATHQPSGSAPNGTITDIINKENTLMTVSSWTAASNGDTCGAPFIYKGQSGNLTRNHDLCVNLDNGNADLYAVEIVGNDLYYGGKFNITNGVLVGPNLGRISYPPGYFSTLSDVVDLTNNLRVSVYPNPNDGLFNIVLPESGESATMTITNIFGAKLWEKTTKQSKITITLDQPAGVYFLTVATSKSKTVQKIIINQ